MKKIIYKVLGISILSTMLFACANNKDVATTQTVEKEVVEETKNENKEESITVMVPDWAVPSDELLAEFVSDTGIKVTINKVDWDAIRDKIAIAATGEEASADVVEVDWSWVGEFSAAEWLEELEVSKEDKEDMTTLSTFSVDGKVLAIPYSNDFRIAYYNKKYFDNAKINEVPKTYDEVYNAMLKIKEMGVLEHPYPLVLTAEEKTTTGLIWTAYTMSGKAFNEDDTLNEEAIKDALEFYQKLIKAELIDPADKTASGGDTYRRLTGGSAAYLTGPTSYVANVNNEEKSKVVGEVVPILMPGKDDVAKNTMALPEALGITKFSKNKEAAKKFIDWYTSKEVQVRLNDELGNLPTRNSVLEELINKDIIKNSGAMLEQAKRIDSPFPNGVPVYYNEMSNAIYNAVNMMVLQDLSVDETFKLMDEKLKEIIEENK